MNALPKLDLHLIPPESNDLQLEALAVSHASDLLNDGVTRIERPFKKLTYGIVGFSKDLDQLLYTSGTNDSEAAEIAQLKQRLFNDPQYHEGDFFRTCVYAMFALTRQRCGTNVLDGAKEQDEKTLDDFAALGKRLIDWAGEKIAEKEIGNG